jgi:hypothetical protein
MPKAIIRPVTPRRGPRTEAACPVCGEKFFSASSGGGAKSDIGKQFNAHLVSRHRRQSEAMQKKTQKRRASA